MDTIVETKFAIMDHECKQYAYMDLGHIKYDDKMPRRSGTASTLDQAKKLQQRFIVEQQAEIDVYEAEVASGTSHRQWKGRVLAKSECDWRVEQIESWKNRTPYFNIVEITVRKLDV